MLDCRFVMVVSIVGLWFPAMGANRSYLTEATPASVAKAIIALGDEASDEESRIELRCMYIGSPVVASLLAILENGDHPPRVYRRTYHCLARLGVQGEAAVKALCPRVASYPSGGTSEIWALTKLRPNHPDAVKAAKKLLHDKEYRYTSSVYELIGSIGPSAAPLVPELKAALAAKPRFTDPSLIYAASSLGAAAEPLIPELVEVLRQSTFQGQHIIHAIARLGPHAKAAAPVIVKRITDSGVQRHQLIICLGEMGPDIQQHLKAIRKVAKPKRVLSDAVALLRIEGKHEEMIALLEDWISQPTRAYRAFDEVIRVGPEAADLLPTILKYHEDRIAGGKETSTRMLKAISSMGNKAAPAVPVLLKSYADEKKRSSKTGIVTTLGTIARKGDKKVLSFLERVALTDDDDRLARDALAARLMVMPSP